MSNEFSKSMSERSDEDLIRIVDDSGHFSVSNPDIVDSDFIS